MRRSWGDTKAAESHYEQALAETPATDDKGRSVTLHNFAGLLLTRGENDRALTLYQQSAEIKQRIGYVSGNAATLHQIAIIKARQGDVESSLALCRQALEIEERFGHSRAKPPPSIKWRH